MAERVDIFEGLDPRQIEIAHRVLAMLSWARTFYINARQLPKESSKTLSHLGAIAMTYHIIYRELRELLHHVGLPDTETFAKIEAVRDHLAKRGSKQGEVKRCIGRDDWLHVDAAVIHGDMMRVREDFFRAFYKPEGGR